MDTLGRDFGTVAVRTQLFGRPGTVAEVNWHAPRGFDGGWEIQVRYDHLSHGTWLSGPVSHQPEDLRPSEVEG